jgi:Ser/Thr protein kinase RdoA (MazF antagonist)
LTLIEDRRRGITVMDEMTLRDILKWNYGVESPSLEFLRESGTLTYIVNSKNKYLLKVVGSAFSGTARQSVSIMRYLEGKGFPVPKTILTKNGEAFFETEIDGEKKLIALMEYIDGDEPELETCPTEVGALVGRFHQLMEKYPAGLVSRGKEFFVDRYIVFLRKKNYSRIKEYEELGELLWDKVKFLPRGNCHGDLHRGNLLQNKSGKLYLVDFDTACRAPLMFDVVAMCDMTDYFNLKQEDIELTKAVYQEFLSGYVGYHKLSREEILSFPYWVAIRHFQLQATILEIYGVDCIDAGFIDGQLYWLNKWQEAIPGFTEELEGKMA